MLVARLQVRLSSRSLVLKTDAKSYGLLNNYFVPRAGQREHLHETTLFSKQLVAVSGNCFAVIHAFFSKPECSERTHQPVVGRKQRSNCSIAVSSNFSCFNCVEIGWGLGGL
eukprot:s974_g17.t1